MAFFTPLETDYPSPQNPSKLKEKQMDKVRRIAHLKLRPFHLGLPLLGLATARFVFLPRLGYDEGR